MMAPKFHEPTLNQKLKPAEYVYSRGKLTRDVAEQKIMDFISDGEISFCEMPRAVRYTLPDGAVRWAIVLTDTALAAYA